ncbi:hypothetical protein GW17_00054035 [Ensete ventricosum]|nr:hypothetical protein GW17_00054035 [Ensete ventricosum]RZS07370.1 hypothetical protein BHM03_00038198 [Ensete ventricosum]
MGSPTPLTWQINSDGSNKSQIQSLVCRAGLFVIAQKAIEPTKLPTRTSSSSCCATESKTTSSLLLLLLWYRSRNLALRFYQYIYRQPFLRPPWADRRSCSALCLGEGGMATTKASSGLAYLERFYSSGAQLLGCRGGRPYSPRVDVSRLTGRDDMATTWSSAWRVRAGDPFETVRAEHPLEMVETESPLKLIGTKSPLELVESPLEQVGTESSLELFETESPLELVGTESLLELVGTESPLELVGIESPLELRPVFRAGREVPWVLQVVGT